MSEAIRLTQYSHGAGCGCKISPKVLEVILAGSGAQNLDPKLWVGNASRDDAAVYALDEERGVVSTTDFFMPIVDDPFDFGRIAATNAISDIYAMGGDPLMAIAILGWPVNVLAAEVAREVIAGGRKVCEEAGIPLAGGHSIDAPEPIFGLAVTGVVEKRFMKRNDTAEAGCRLYLTKPLGIGILTTAEKKARLRAEDVGVARDWMCTLNRPGARFGRLAGVKAMTDVTGFGLLGHLVEMADGSKLTARVEYAAVPRLASAEYYLEQGCVPGGTLRNFDSYGERIAPLPEVQKLLLCDPQTSGGLLVAVAWKARRSSSPWRRNSACNWRRSASWSSDRVSRYRCCNARQHPALPRTVSRRYPPDGCARPGGVPQGRLSQHCQPAADERHRAAEGRHQLQAARPAGRHRPWPRTGLRGAQGRTAGGLESLRRSQPERLPVLLPRRPALADRPAVAEAGRRHRLPTGDRRLQGVAQLPFETTRAAVDECDFVLVGGLTGCGKTEVIAALDNSLDLEGHANHRGSSFGRRATPQPAQIDFENRLAIDILKKRHRGVGQFVLEDEGRIVGSCSLPLELYQGMQGYPLVWLEDAFEQRVERILRDYVIDLRSEFERVVGVEEGFAAFSAYLQKSLAGIVKRLGGERYQRLAAILVQALEEQGRDGSVDTHRGWIEGLLKEYYDPMYAFQRQSKEDRVEFRGNQAEVIGYLRQRQALRPS